MTRVLVRFDHVGRFIVNMDRSVPICLAKVARFFQNSAHMKTKTLPLRNLISCAPCRLALLLIPAALACFALSPAARAVCQEGCLTNQNTVLGDDALLNNTGPNNTAVGFDALFSNTTGHENTAVGSRALSNNTTGQLNTAVGEGTLTNDSSGLFNTAIGGAALFSNQTGSANVAVGTFALFNNTSSFNTAIGDFALSQNTTGFDNTATGREALESNTTGGSNTADGVGALILNRTGSNNTATGEFALFENDASQNTADGQNALRHNTTGNNNTAIGQASLSHNTTGSNNTGIGQNALRFNKTGSFNIGLGVNAGSELTTGDNNIDIANKGVAGEENTIRIGKAETQTATFIAGISGATVPDGVGVIIDTSGHLGTVVSSARFKDGIKPMDKASESVLALKPVTFRYKHELDPEGIPQFGLVAEQVEKVNPDLVVRDAKGRSLHCALRSRERDVA